MDEFKDKKDVNVVVVNDDPTQLKILAGLLKNRGIKVNPYETAEKALSALNDNAVPDLIVTDLYMPVIGGWRFCRLLRSDEYKAFNSIPILIVSATFAGDEASRITADLGANAFLPSPVNGKLFIDTVHSLITGKQPVHKQKILLVEDNQSQAVLLKKSFENKGYRVRVENTLESAKQWISTHCFDLAVMDYHLPDGPGDALLEKIRTTRPDVICIMMTTDPSPELALQWMQKGAAAYLRKPFKPDYLLEICFRTERERSLLRVKDLLEKRTRELNESSAAFQTLFEGINDAVMVHEIDKNGAPGRFLHVNDAACDRLAYTREELLTMTPKEITSPEEFIKIARYRNQLKFQKNILLETCHITKHGQRIPVESNITRFLYKGKNAAVSICRDITERKLAEAKINYLKKSESLGRMAGAVAHHYNNLLSIIMGNLDLVLTDLPEHSEFRHNLHQAMRAARRAAKTGSMMLEYLGQTDVKKSILDLSLTCREFMSALRLETPSHIKTVENFETPDLSVMANPGQIRQIMENILINSWEAMEETPGTVSIRTCKTCSRDIPSFYCYPATFQPDSDSYACLEIKDTGCGIPKNEIEKIFEPFYSTKFTGRGLGLSVTLGAVIFNKGCITIDSARDKGTTIKVFFPLSSAPVTDPRPKTAAPGLTPQGQATILLVDDQNMVRKTAKAMLQRIGCKVVTAKNGQEALETFKSRQTEISAVLSDLNMPGINGWELIKTLHQIQPGIPVILTSGFDEARVLADEHHDNQPAAFLSKPFQLKTLKNTIEKVLK